MRMQFKLFEWLINVSNTKVAGAMAEKGESLESIAEKLEEMKLYIGTMGASLTSCCVPGIYHSFVDIFRNSFDIN